MWGIIGLADTSVFLTDQYEWNVDNIIIHVSCYTRILYGGSL